MYFRQIEYILAVSELRNFGQAADRCAITQSTLSTMIGRFEDEIGIRIFNRKTKPVSVTKEGEQLLGQLRIISKEVYNFREVVKDLKGELSGSLKIGVIPTLAPYLLPHFLQEFISRFPTVHFEISEITTDKIIQKIEQRELDIGLVSIPLDNPQLQEIHLFDEPFLLYDQVAAEMEGNSTIQEIDFERLWLLEEGHCMRTQAETICGLREKQPTSRNLEYKSGTIDTLMKYVRKNEGVTLLPYLATLELAEQEHTYLQAFEEPVPARSIGLVVHQHFVKKRLLKYLKDEIIEKVNSLMVGKFDSLRMVSPI
ncbi:MAG: LysR substrate-binding domain-containing protein [Bacteroidota bacterium]